MALYEISQGKSATLVGKQTNRNPQTVMSWVHRYNREGLTSLQYIGHKLRKSEKSQGKNKIE